MQFGFRIDNLVAEVALFETGMADNIDDGDAINYAAQFDATVANQSTPRICPGTFSKSPD